MKANEKIGGKSMATYTAAAMPVSNGLSPYLQAVLNAKSSNKIASQQSNDATALERVFKYRRKP